MLKTYQANQRNPEREFQYRYTWKGFPQGVTKVTASPMDAVLEVIQMELKLNCHRGWLYVQVNLSDEYVSRCRAQGGRFSRHEWLLNCAVFSGISYADLCDVAGVKPKVMPYRNREVMG